jgi:hypothetical protein
MEVARKAQIEEQERETERNRQEQAKRLKDLEARINKPAAPAAPSSAGNKANSAVIVIGAGKSSSASGSKTPDKGSHASHNDDDDDDGDESEDDEQSTSKTAPTSSALEARLSELEDKARAKPRKGGKGGKGVARDEIEPDLWFTTGRNKKGQHQQQLQPEQAKKRLEAEQQLHRDFEERAAEEAAELAARKAKLDAELRVKLEREIAAMRSTHNAEFQSRVEQEVARRLEEIDKKVRERHDAERAARAASDVAAAGVSSASGGAGAAAAAAAAAVVEIELSTPHAMPGDKITATYRYKKGAPTKRDWVGFYKGTRALDSNQYYTQKYTDAQPTGRVEFVVPNKLGVCELRFFQNGNYEFVARSPPLHVGPRVAVCARIEGLSVVVRRQQLSGSASTWDWVAIYAHDEPNCTKMIGAHQYLSAEPDATTILKCPKQPGS